MLGGYTFLYYHKYFSEAQGSAGKSNLCVLTNKFESNLGTAGPWLMRFSVVRFSLVRSLKKIQKNLAYADFHQSPSLVRKIWHMLIFHQSPSLVWFIYVLPILTSFVIILV